MNRSPDFFALLAAKYGAMAENEIEVKPNVIRTSSVALEEAKHDRFGLTKQQEHSLLHVHIAKNMKVNQNSRRMNQELSCLICGHSTNRLSSIEKHIRYHL